MSGSEPRRTRAFLFTWNNYPEAWRERLDPLPTKYWIVGHEKAPETGTPHLQGYVYFKSAKTVESVKSALRGCHVQVARGDSLQNYIYCSKDGDFVEKGVRPLTQEEKGEAERKRWAAALKSAKSNRFDDIDPDIVIRHWNSLKRIAVEYMAHQAELDGTCGVWIHGASGCGKSRSVKQRYPNAFPKPVNRWWDGYRNEEVVCIEDIDPNHSKLGYHIKIWADRYPFIGEVKGYSTRIRPALVVVTSQFHPREIWPLCRETLDAVERRFIIIKKEFGQDIILPAPVGRYSSNAAEDTTEAGGEEV